MNVLEIFVIPKIYLVSSIITRLVVVVALFHYNNNCIWNFIGHDNTEIRLIIEFRVCTVSVQLNDNFSSDPKKSSYDFYYQNFTIISYRNISFD
jgi:hypothetical protein